MTAIGDRHLTFGQLPPRKGDLTQSELVQRVALKVLLTTTYLMFAAAVAGALFPPTMPYALLAGGLLSLAVSIYHIAKGVHLCKEIAPPQPEPLNLPYPEIKNEWNVAMSDEENGFSRESMIKKATHSIQISGTLTVSEITAIHKQLATQPNLHVYLLTTDDLDLRILRESDRFHCVVTSEKTPSMDIIDEFYFGSVETYFAGTSGKIATYHFFHLFAKHDPSHQLPPGAERKAPEVNRPKKMEEIDCEIITHAQGEEEFRISAAYQDVIANAPKSSGIVIHRKLDARLTAHLIEAIQKRQVLQIFNNSSNYKVQLFQEARKYFSHVRWPYIYHPSNNLCVEGATIIGDASLDHDRDGIVFVARSRARRLPQNAKDGT